MVGWVVGLHFADAANSNDHGLVMGIGEGIERVDVGNLLEQFGL